MEEGEGTEARRGGGGGAARADGRRNSPGRDGPDDRAGAFRETTVLDAASRRRFENLAGRLLFVPLPLPRRAALLLTSYHASSSSSAAMPVRP